MNALQSEPEFSKNSKGVFLAHELSEIESLRKGEYQKGKSQFELECLAEEKARNFLEKQGFDMKHYETYHEIRSGTSPGQSKGELEKSLSEHHGRI